LNKGFIERENRAFVKLGLCHRITQHTHYLIEIADLKKTNETKKSSANKRLLEKLKRLEDKGVIVKSPQKINEMVSIRIR